MTARVRSLRLPGRPDQVRSARRFVADELGAEHACRDDAVLLVSETATNAVEHTGSGGPGGHFVVTVSHTDTWARIVVSDEGSHSTPCFCRVSVESTEGRGSELLDNCAARWGITREPDGTRVWFDVGLSAADAVEKEGRGLEVEPAGETGGHRPALPRGHGTAA
ncbi:ATP-binding protein [Actinocorallia longicatena]|uniref:Histidine kinase/HSP90-like ATPase domain-containing protein n=1 Tax=Actinocorallia longicatena TaxID=111803 RepID=A0ABP6QAH2_9ACTN